MITQKLPAIGEYVSWLHRSGEMLEDERAAAISWMDTVLHLNISDCIQSPDVSKTKSSTQKCWRAGDVKLTDRQLFARLRKYLNEQLSGSWNMVWLVELGDHAERFISWAATQWPEINALAAHQTFFRDVRAVIASYKFESVAKEITTGSEVGDFYASLLGDIHVFRLQQWQEQKTNRKFHHESYGRASKLDRNNEFTERLYQEIKHESKNKIAWLRESSLSHLVNYVRGLNRMLPSRRRDEEEREDADGK